jgi:hypothetical protein
MSNMNPLENMRMVVPRNPARAIDDQTTIMRGLLSGRATFDALDRAVKELRRLAPNDCDVWIKVGDVLVRKAVFVEPHTFSFEGVHENGDRAWVVQHFSQLSVTVIYRPKLKTEANPFTSGVFIGFRTDTPSA